LIADSGVSGGAHGVETFIERSTDGLKDRKGGPFSDEEKERLVARYATMSVFRRASQAQLADVQTQIINKYDWDGLRQMNAEFFSEYPMNLDFVVDGESYGKE
jgi:hypothetical protein